VVKKFKERGRGLVLLLPMPKTFISEAIQPVGGFDSAPMANGEPGIPVRFRWRKAEQAVAGVLEHWKEHGDCRNGSGERYVRKHGYRLRMADETVWSVYFQRSFGKTRAAARWWLRGIEPGAEVRLATGPVEVRSAA
jgi:hypothetical protein